MLGCFLGLYWCSRYGLRQGRPVQMAVLDDDARTATYYHIMISVFSYVMLNAIGVLAYRICCHCHPRARVALHAGPLGLTLVGTLLASHYGRAAALLQPHSLVHAAMGLCVYICFPVQFVLGAVVALWPRARATLRDAHRALGVAVLGVAALTVVGALAQEQTRQLGSDGQMVPMSHEHAVYMLAASCISLSYFIIIFILMRREISATQVIIVPDSLG